MHGWGLGVNWGEYMVQGACASEYLCTDNRYHKCTSQLGPGGDRKQETRGKDNLKVCPNDLKQEC